MHKLIFLIEKRIVSQLLTFALANYLFCFINDQIVVIEMNTAVTYTKCIAITKLVPIPSTK
jgi:hypothetical protein